MSSSTTSVFADLIVAYPTWDALSAFLTSEMGGSLRVKTALLTPESPYALIHYVKGKSDFSKAHVGAFRSVVWDTTTNRPVSVTSFKSEAGESMPIAPYNAADHVVEQFVDGVMIGMFWDSYSNRWRIHTRTTLDAECRYYSQTKTFCTMFEEATRADLDYGKLSKTNSYTFVLQHPENRIVCAVATPRATLVENIVINGKDGKITFCHSATYPYKGAMAVVDGIGKWEDVNAKLGEWNTRFRHNIQGIVIKDLEGRRWKVRGADYNSVRALRGNTSRRDFHWLGLWRTGTLPAYLNTFPEERALANAIVARWKETTNSVFHLYTDAFKARTLERNKIPQKFRPLVYGLHSKFLEELKPAGKKVDWKTCLEYMNARDTAQMLFVVNWEVREAAKAAGVPSIPIEPQVPTAVVDMHTDVEAGVEAGTAVTGNKRTWAGVVSEDA